ncbi:MAG: NAD(P)/FAD-dependent oxidoreductase [Alphaproteobacteria bacterium]|nr:NAD(P)/FAD-dependent oxidoreductase [Alphaproteobacteria bacterium]
MKQKLVIIGNGMAPGRALEKLFDTAPDQYDVTIFNAENRVNYDRIMLSPVLSGEKKFEDIIIHGDGWYIKNNVMLYKGHKVTNIDRVKKQVTSEHGEVADYDKLVIATGSNPFIIPVPGHKLAGVLSYRDLDDVTAMMLAAKARGSAVVIGGGLLGLEAAAGLKEQGMDVTVVHLMPTLMERQLDPAAGYMLEQELESRGIKVLCGANTKEIAGESKVEAVHLDDGTVIPASLVVMAVGIRPNNWLAQDAGLEVNRGIVVSDNMQTSDPDIFSLGECAEVGGVCYGLVAPLYQMANVLAANLTGDKDAKFVAQDTPTRLKVTGINLYSAGDFADGDDREEIVFRDASSGVYKRLVIKDDKIIGVVLYGEAADGPWFFEKLKTSEDISEIRDMLIFGQNAVLGGANVDPLAAVTALPDSAEICGCNGICKGDIVTAINEKGLTSLGEVRAHTKASASCGSCTGLVEQLMTLTLGNSFDANAIQSMCPCTDLGHSEVRRLIKAKDIKSIPQLMQELEWKTSCGCVKCRPALNYYLVADWPGEYVDDYQSRFINERVHANIQKDGTYSVIPRMWGGYTNSKELRAIADVVDKFNIPTVKCTGGQRIDMLGIKKQDLPAVWEDLGKAGFVSGHAYAKGLRTVKTCVGTDWCRMGTQDSTGLGIKLEKMMWGAWTPAKLKLAVSGCPRNCSEATCKDIGVICVDSGYDIHFAGAAGLDLKATVVLGHVDSEAETIIHIIALAQMYREQGHYLERIYKWADRVGIDEIKAQIMDNAEQRQTYYDAFIFAQTFAQVDPWDERVSGLDKHEFNPMAVLELEAAQ